MNRRTNENALLNIGIVIVLFAIPQILFFWLAPEAVCRNTVYGFMTGYTFLHLLACVFLRLRKGMRIAAAPIYLSTLFLAAEYAACGILLAVNASASTAAFALVILGLIHVLTMSVLFNTLER